MRHFKDYEDLESRICKIEEPDVRASAVAQIITFIFRLKYKDQDIEVRGMTDRHFNLHELLVVRNADQIVLEEYSEETGNAFKLRIADEVDSKIIVTNPEELQRIYKIYDAVDPFIPAENKGDEQIIEKGVDIPVDLIDPSPFQYREHFTDLEELGESLKVLGQLQPIGVKKIEERYQLVFGERRLRSAKMIGWDKIRADIYSEETDSLSAGAAENFSKSNLRPTSAAKLIVALRKYIKEHNRAGNLKDIMPSDVWKDEKKKIEDLNKSNEHIDKAIQQIIGIGKSYQYKLVSILSGVSDEIAEAIDKGEMSVKEGELIIQMRAENVPADMVKAVLNAAKSEKKRKRLEKKAKKEDTDASFLDYFKFIDRFDKVWTERRVDGKTMEDTKSRVTEFIKKLMVAFEIGTEELDDYSNRH